MREHIDVKTLKSALGQNTLSKLKDLLHANWHIATQGKPYLLQNPLPTEDQLFEVLLSNLADKIPMGKNIVIERIALEAFPEETATVTVHGEKAKLTIAGSTRFVGVVRVDNEIVTVHHRFIGKTFYQYVGRKRKAE